MWEHIHELFNDRLGLSLKGITSTNRSYPFVQTKSVPLLYGHTLDNLGLTKAESSQV